MSEQTPPHNEQMDVRAPQSALDNAPGTPEKGSLEDLAGRYFNRDKTSNALAEGAPAGDAPEHQGSAEASKAGTAARDTPDTPGGKNAGLAINSEPPSMPSSLLESGGNTDGAKEGGVDGHQGGEGAPDAYAEFTVPEGFAVDTELMASFTQEARGMNLSQEQAQRLIDLQARVETNKKNAWHAQLADWNNQLRADPEYGGKHIGTTLADANAALKAFDKNGELRGTLIRDGYEHHPALMRFLANAGRSLRREGGVIKGRETTPARERSIAEKLWPNWKV